MRLYSKSLTVEYTAPLLGELTGDWFYRDRRFQRNRRRYRVHRSYDVHDRRKYDRALELVVW